MDKEIRRLIVEIISIVLLLCIAVPICVNASSEYRTKKEAILVGGKTNVDISNKGEYKEIKVTSNSNKLVKVNLFMRISKYSDRYLVYLDDQIYNLSDLEYSEDEEYFYYSLGVYEVMKEKTFNFKIKVKDKSYYDETISYGFFTEGFI